MKVFATRLIDITEQKAPDIAKQWYADVKNNPRTPSYHKLSEDEAIPQATDFYRHFRSLFMAEKPYEMAQQVFSRYAVDRFAEGVPLPEAIYALTLMRRHIWLYAEFQAIFTSTIERQVVVESLNRTILLFDYATHVITQKYQDLMKEEYDGKLAALEPRKSHGIDATSGIFSMAAFLITPVLLRTSYQAVIFYPDLLRHLVEGFGIVELMLDHQPSIVIEIAPLADRTSSAAIPSVPWCAILVLSLDHDSPCLSIKGGVHHDYQRGRSVQGNSIAHHRRDCTTGC